MKPVTKAILYIIASILVALCAPLALFAAIEYNHPISCAFITVGSIMFAPWLFVEALFMLKKK